VLERSIAGFPVAVFQESFKGLHGSRRLPNLRSTCWRCSPLKLGVEL
jgi:hypothetical protein